MKGQKIVVTGGAGFIGSNLVEALAAENDVIIIDDLSSGRLQNIEHLLKLPNVRFIQGSITDPALMREAFKGVDYVFHQAAVASVPLSIREPLRVNEVNIHGTLNVLVAAHERRVNKVIFASSCAVYGDAPTLPVREDMPPNPLSPYAVTKVTGEHYCDVFSRVYGLRTISLRYFNVYGPRQDPGSQYAAVVPKFISAALAGRPLTIFGDGNQTRDFVFVEDVVTANIAAAEAEVTGTFNIASGRQTSVIELARLVVKLAGHDISLLHQPSLPGEIRYSLADISRARQFGYSPKYDIEQGIAKTFSSLRASRFS